MEPPIGNPLESWVPFAVAFLVGLVVAIRTYMRGPECPSQARIQDKTVIITGANTGIGKQVALELARRGGTIILACRDVVKGEAAAKEIAEMSGNQNVSNLELDLQSFDSVVKFVKQFGHKHETLDVLVNNAAVMLAPFTKTRDGFETHFQVNYLSHFLLTNLLLNKLKASHSARIVNVSALAHRAATLHLEDLNLEQNYVAREAYGQSKLAMVLFTNHLAKRLEGTNVTVNCLHPGIVRNTELVRHTALNKCFVQTAALPLTWVFLKAPKDGAQTAVYLAVAPEMEKITGKYFSDCEVKSPSLEAQDEELAEKLWNISFKFTKLNEIKL